MYMYVCQVITSIVAVCACAMCSYVCICIDRSFLPQHPLHGMMATEILSWKSLGQRIVNQFATMCQVIMQICVCTLYATYSISNDTRKLCVVVFHCRVTTMYVHVQQKHLATSCVPLYLLYIHVHVAVL